MLLPNNTEIKVEALNEKLQGMAEHRRRDIPLLASADTQADSARTARDEVVASPDLPATGFSLRRFIAEIPVIGKVAVGLSQRMRVVLAPGLHWQQRVRLVPVVGSVGAWVFALARLATNAQRTEAELARLRMFEEAAKDILAQMNARLRQFDEIDIAARLRQFDEVNIASRLKQLDEIDIAARLRQLDEINIAGRLKQFDEIDIAARLKQFDVIDIAARLGRLDHFAGATSSATMTLDNRVAGITRELRRMTEAADIKVSSPEHETLAVPIENAASDSFYIDFEDAFRGSRDDITARLQAYLPHVDKFLGDATAHAVDIGCGRGEWLALLGQHGVKATGIDLNGAMVDTCHELGLQAQCMDALAYLRSQPEGSLALVTGFHIIEHLPFDMLLCLFDAALRALRPDGMIIFETPNPENLFVGACSFHSDPTHLHPIVPAVAQFMARQRGFARAEILRLHPYPESHLLVEDSELAKRFNEALYGPQDFALLAWKTHAI